jgi:hypothetical protein
METALDIRFEKAKKIIDAIGYFERRKKVLLYCCNEQNMFFFPNLKNKYLHQADICDRASKRLTKKLLSKNF